MRRCWVLAMLLLADVAGAATVQRLSPGQLADRSEVVFVGTVTGQRTTLETAPVKVWTDTTFAVEQLLKGPKLATYTLRQLGGDAGRWVQKVPGYAQFQQGERVLLFLERTATGRLVVTGLAQGKFTLTTDAKSGEIIAERTFAGLNFATPAPRSFAGTPANPNRMRLRDLAAIVAGHTPTPRPIVIPHTLQKRTGGAR